MTDSASTPVPAPAAAQPTHINSATLVMGPTGGGKTSLFATLMKYVWKRYQKVSLLYSTDGGGFPTEVQALVAAGICRVWRMRTRGETLETCIRASQGWFPSRIQAATGETAPSVKLVPPLTSSFVLSCPQGHEIRRMSGGLALGAANVCPTCKINYSKDQIQVAASTIRTPGFETVGAVFYDGGSSMCTWMMNDLAARDGRLELKGEGSALGGRVTSGELMLGSNNRAHYGFVQARIEEMVLNSLGIPGLVVPPVWSALLLEAVDEGGLSVKGPKLIGKAKTDEAPAWFANTLEAIVAKNADGKDVHRLYLQEYIDGEGYRHLCKNRAAPGTMPPFLEDPYDPSGASAFSQFNLGLFFELQDQALANTMDRIDQEFPDAPGLPSGPSEYGLATPEPTAPTPPLPRAPATPRPTPAPRPTPRPPAAAASSASPELTPTTSAPAAAAVPLRPTPPTSAAPTPMTRPLAPPPGPRPPARAPRVGPPVGSPGSTPAPTPSVNPVTQE
jgi:hypothetical protein